MRFVWKVLTAGLVSLALVGCASMHSAAEQYAAAGKHELAIHYYGNIYLTQPEDESARTNLKQSMNAAMTSLKADYDEAIRSKQGKKALGIALRRHEISGFMIGLGLRDWVSGFSYVQEIQTAQKLAAKNAIQAVDQAEANGTPQKQLLRLLGSAIALDPDNEELAGRQARLRQTLLRNIGIKIQCSRDNQDACHNFAGRLRDAMTNVNHELIQIVPIGSDIQNAELIIRLQQRLSDTNWTTIQRGTATCQQNKLNELKEKIRNSKGQPVMVTRKATYAVYQRVTKAEVKVDLTIRDLKPPRDMLFQDTKTGTQSDTKKYFTFNGDERAFSSVCPGQLTNPASQVPNYGTNQSAPLPARGLVPKTLEALANTLAKAIIQKLENS